MDKIPTKTGQSYISHKKATLQNLGFNSPAHILGDTKPLKHNFTKPCL